MKAALVFQSLGIGGIERVGVEYARLFQDLGYEVDIYNLTPGTEQMEASFPKGCTFHHKSESYFFTYGAVCNKSSAW